MPVVVDVAEDFALLAQQLCARLGGTADPFDPQVVVVPSAGVARWLQHRVADHLGVSANIDFVLPGQFTRRIKEPLAPDAVDGWTIEDITGAIYAVGRLEPGDESETQLDQRLAELQGRGSWMSRSRYIADLFDRYIIHRPEMVVAWSEGRDVDGQQPQAQPLPESFLWQPELWRRVADTLGASPAERILEDLARIANGEVAESLPAAVHLFGLSSMSQDFLGLVNALSSHADVWLYSRVSSPALVSSTFAGRGTPPPTHPLLRTWNRAQIEGIEQLVRALDPETAVKVHEVAEAAQETLLDAVRHQVVTNVEPRSQSLFGLDQTVQVHSCSGDARQVEVLRDAILHRMRVDPTLRESDVVVLCPQLDRFAPILEAVWGETAPHDSDLLAGQEAGDGIRLRYSSNHRTLRAASPLLEATTRLFSLVGGRMTHSALSSFAALEPVRQRFGWVDDFDLSAVDAWFENTALRWGLSARHRADHATLPENFEKHTLGNTIHAVMAGIALPSGAIGPDDTAATTVDISQMDLAGNVAGFASALEAAHASFVEAGPASAPEWQARVLAAVDALFATDPTELWQQTRLAEVLASIVDTLPEGTLLGHEDFADAFRSRVDELSGWRRFGDGSIIIDGLQALRSIPHRVVCILGFDDDSVPRDSSTADDLIAAAPHPGDRDRRADTKQQLLDAVLAAQDALIITFNGHSIHTNAEVPPTVALAELIDVVEIVAGAAGRTDENDDRLVREHSRYAHHESNFAAAPWSFDSFALDTCRAKAERVHALPELPEPLVDAAPAFVSVDDLAMAIKYPVRLFTRDRLKLRYPPQATLPSDVLPVALNALERWGLGDDLLGAKLRGDDLMEWVGHKDAAGQLPPGTLAHSVLEVANTRTGGLLAEMEKHTQLSGEALAEALVPELVPVDLRLTVTSDSIDREVTIGGALPLQADMMVIATYSKLKAAHKLDVWFRALLASAALDRPVSGLVVATADGDKVQSWSMRIVEDDDAIEAAVSFAVNLHAQALREVVPLFAETSKLLAADGEPEWFKAAKQWRSSRSEGVRGESTQDAAGVFFEGWAMKDLQDAAPDMAILAQQLWAHVDATIAEGADVSGVGQ